jgi:predicted Zn-dependent protease with MMP-like domain
MNREKFEWLVTQAVDSLPKEFRSRMENIDIVVQDKPTPEQLTEVGMKRSESLLGLYEGVPLTKRGHSYGMVVPDKITLFQKPIEAICNNDTGVIAEVRRVTYHEIAHHFGISDTRLEQLERNGD